MASELFDIMATANRLHATAAKIDPHFPKNPANYPGKAAQEWMDFQVYLNGHWQDIVAGLLDLGNEVVDLKQKLKDTGKDS